MPNGVIYVRLKSKLELKIPEGLTERDDRETLMGFIQTPLRITAVNVLFT